MADQHVTLSLIGDECGGVQLKKIGQIVERLQQKFQ